MRLHRATESGQGTRRCIALIQQNGKGLQEQELIRRTLGFVPEEGLSHCYPPVANSKSLRLRRPCCSVTSRVLPRLRNRSGRRASCHYSMSISRHGIYPLLNVTTASLRNSGDAILATFNVLIEDPEHANKALQAALEMNAAVSAKKYAGHSVNHRIGINTGPVVAGAVGATGRLVHRPRRRGKSTAP